MWPACRLGIMPVGYNYTMGPADALRAVKFLRPKIAIPMHYHSEGLLQQDPQAWKKQVESETDTRVIILQPGESMTF